MGLIDGAFSLLFGSGRNVVAETVGIFRENAEAAGQREAEARSAVLNQYAAEFAAPRKSGFDAVIDGINRIPRPAMALGTLGLFLSAMIDPLWFATRMQGLALVPEPLWWLLGAVVSFYFGARHQAKGQEFQRSIAETLARAPVVQANVASLQSLDGEAPAIGPGAPADPAVHATPTETAGPNPALDDWRRA